MAEKPIISILGCGWLGLPLAEHLIMQGYLVKGSTTQPEKLDLLTQKGLEAFLVKLTPTLETSDFATFLKSHTLIINIPPGVRFHGEDFHPAQMAHLLPLVDQSSIKNIIYVSSTSVYPNLNREITEEEPLDNLDGSLDGVGSKGVNRALLKVEKMLQALPNQQVTIVRAGGLIGEDRIPGRYVAGKKGLTTGDVPVNYVHPVDLVKIIGEIIKQNAWGEIFNAVAPLHPKRREVYAQNAQLFNLAPPEYVDGSPDFKIINGNKVIQRLNYDFEYPNPLEFRYITMSTS